MTADRTHACLSRRALLAGGAAVAGCAASPALARPPQDLAAVLDLAMARRSTSVLVGRTGDVLADTSWVVSRGSGEPGPVTALRAVHDR